MAPNRTRPERSRLHELLADEHTRLSWDQLEAFGDEWETLNARQRMEAMRRAHQAELDR